MPQPKTYRKQAIDENRYAAAFAMATLGQNTGRSTLVSDMNPNHLTMMAGQAGQNLLFREARVNSMTVSLSIKGYRFAEKWSTLTDMNGKVIEGFNPRTLERYTHPATYNSAWRVEEGLSDRVTSLLTIY